jgi:curved DNA-binding protein CbpA
MPTACLLYLCIFCLQAAAARLYHPDRNPGKELEYVPKFQSIQAAHEILSDPEQRAKYDADRRKMGYGAGGLGVPRNTGTAPGQTNFARSPYATYSNWPPPPRRGNRAAPAPPPAPPPPPSYASTSAYQTRRAANFANQQRPPPPRVPPRGPPAEGANARANVFTAWQHMQGERARQEQQQQQQPQPQPRHTSHEPAYSEDERKGRAARDAAKAHTQKPGLGRSNTTKMPKKPGFDPSDPDEGGWEPQAARTSAYSAYVHSPRQSPPEPMVTPPYPPPPPRSPAVPPRAPTAKHDTWSMDGNDSWSRGGDEDAPFTEGNERLSTPYTSHGGEKTYFDTDSLRRSASTHAARKMAAQGSGARHRSASPAARTKAPNLSSPNPSMRRPGVPPAVPNNSKPRMPPGTGTAKSPFQFGYSDSDADADSEEEPTSPDTKYGGPSDPARRPKAQPGKFWSASNTPGKDNSTSQTAPETPIDGNPGSPPMYDKFLFKSDPSQHRTQSGVVGADNVDKKENTTSVKYPYWAIPSGLKVGKNKFSPISSKSTSSPIVSESGFISRRKKVSLVSLNSPIATTVPQSEYSTNVLSSSRFNFSTAHSEGPNKPKSRSTENVTTAFSAEEWDGKFEGSKGFVPHPSPGRKGSYKGRTSPLRRSSRIGTARNPVDLADDGFPPPPPNPPPFNGDGTGLEQPASATASGPGPVKFSSEEWAETLKDAKFFYPNLESSRSTSPQKANAASMRRTKVSGRGRKTSKSDARPFPPTAGSGGDASDEADHRHKTAPSTAYTGPSMDSDAMDIDSESPVANRSSPRTAKEPRNVHVPPMRAEWRETAVPTPGGKVAAGAIPTAVPNAVVPPPPPKGKKTRGSGNINLGDLKNVTPFSSSAEGLEGMGDLSGTLPFESVPSSHPIKTFQPQHLELPAVPKAPGTLPASIRIREDQWRAYVAAMSFYMGTWYQFNDKMLTHFNTRHASARKFGTGYADQNATKLLQAMGEGSSEEGLASYIAGLEEDVRVRRHWDVACEKHREAVEAFASVKARVKVEGLVRD